MAQAFGNTLHTNTNPSSYLLKGLFNTKTTTPQTTNQPGFLATMASIPSAIRDARWGTNTSGLMSTAAPQSANWWNTSDSSAAPQTIANQDKAATQDTTPVQPATTTATAQPLAMSTPSGLAVTGNPATWSGVDTSAQTTPGTRGLFADVLSSLAGYRQNYNDLSTKAGQISDKFAQQYADVGGKGARFQAGQLTTGTTPVAEGNAAVTAQTTAAQQQALAEAAGAQLTGVGKQIEANQAATNALGTVAGYAAPQPAAYGQTVFNPVTGDYTGGGGLPDAVMQQYAQMAATGQYSAIPSFITSNPVLNAQLNAAASALNPSYTPVGAAGASSVLAGIPALTSANTAAEGIKNTITSYLQSNPQLNPSDLAAGNLLQQWIQGKQLTDPKYQTLFNYLNEYTNTLAPILGVGGDPTNLKTQIAQGFVNAAASGQSITEVLDAMSTLATNKINDISSGATGGGTTVPSMPTGEGLFNW